MDFMHDQLSDSRIFRTFNVIYDFNREARASRSTSPCLQAVSSGLVIKSLNGAASRLSFAVITAPNV